MSSYARQKTFRCNHPPPAKDHRRKHPLQQRPSGGLHLYTHWAITPAQWTQRRSGEGGLPEQIRHGTEPHNIKPQMPRFQVKITHQSKNQENLSLNEKKIHRSQPWGDSKWPVKSKTAIVKMPVSNYEHTYHKFKKSLSKETDYRKNQMELQTQ